MKHTSMTRTLLASSILLGLTNMSVYAQESETDEADVERIEVKGSLGSLPGQDVESVFGFGKSILETPRSASTISGEQLERFSVSDIDELVAFSPGTFTQSFFGVAGSLDVRGTPGETYFRGVKRLDNPGNYPTPIGASGRIDIVRGPASPIYGPAKIGGYLNFNPKSARAASGQYLEAPEGAISYTAGTWDKSILTAEVGGPGKVADKEVGYYFYGEIENSGSYYDNTDTDQTILQASFNIDISDKFRIEFGAMYHDYEGNQVAGWNRLTQDLIDNGTYITGTAQPLDTDGDGSISHAEFGASTGVQATDFDGNLSFDDAGNPIFITNRDLINPFIFTPAFENGLADITDAFFNPLQALENVGTTTLSRNQVLVAADDTLENEAITLYFDAIYYTDNGWEIKNQLFFDSYDNLNENAYGFAQFHDSWVIEDKLIFAKEFFGNGWESQVQLSPSLRYTDFEHGDDFTDEYFDRRDLTGPSTALDRRLLATRSGEDFDNYDVGDYLDLGVAALVDVTWDFGLNVVLGLRYDTIDIDSTSREELLLSGTPGVTPDISASSTEEGASWNVSVSYKTPIGLIPYITAAEQGTLVAGQGAEIGVGQLAAGAFDTSELFEYGVKGSFLDDSLYFALSIYEQERTDFSAQAIVTNATTNTEGLEFELRWVATEQLVLSLGYTNVEVVNLTAISEGSQFSFLGAGDLPNVTDPSILFGGAAIGLIPVNSESDARKAGIPENVYTATATYDFQNGFSVNGSIVRADETFSGFSQAVELPAYTLVNAGAKYDAENWSVSLNIKNLTDERYFRANFPDLFGSQVVLPELPRHYQAKFAYKF
ncbi:TonB-dependent receptor [Alteromonas sp. 5E99-2]|uniref:TonB-dependent siderophore receptor n=1 Tax=Alteromonas sp. 5E99-2 TaxID=2817683 RepID=UPI001A97EB91|nr:TonB-dependent receptor [Alteromonas sp. 5E99-2]MBO1254757.1 TonB-dependent receptor [Alteromonas sp. 5E99-2]